MNEISTWSEVFLRSFQAFGQKFMSAIPAILGAIIIIVLGWLLAKFLSKGVTRLLHVLKFDILAEKIRAAEFLKKANVKLTPSAVIGTFVYWVLLLLVIVSASDALGWTAVSNEISKLLSLLPNLMFAIIFFVVGTYIATFVRDIINGTAASIGIGTGKIISSFVFYLLLILITLTALSQAGVDTSIITSNLMLILGAILAAAAISYGFASKDALANILASYYNRRTFITGQIIELEGIRGKIVDTNNISVTVQISDNEKVVIPALIN